MSAKISQLPLAEISLADLQRQHAGCVAADIAKVAQLIREGEKKQANLHTPFVSHMVTARRFNREALPAKALDADKIHLDALCDNHDLFRFDFKDAQEGRTLTINSPWVRQEVIKRVIWDSSPYLDNACKWLLRNQQNNNLEIYSNPAATLRLLDTIPSLSLRSGDILAQQIQQHLRDLRQVETARLNAPAAP